MKMIENKGGWKRRKGGKEKNEEYGSRGSGIFERRARNRMEEKHRRRKERVEVKGEKGEERRSEGE